MNFKKTIFALLFSINSIFAYANSEAIDIQNKIIENEHEIAIKSNERKALDQDLLIFEEQKRLYISEIGKKQSLINDLDSRNKEMQGNVDNLNEQLSAATRELDALFDQERSLRDKERKCKNEFIWIISCFFTNELNKISDKRNHLRRQQARFDMEIREKKTIINENKNELSRLTLKINESQNDIDALTKKIDETLEKWRSINTEIDALNDYIFKLKSSLLALN
jgi:chromosome segregation ATPase